MNDGAYVRKGQLLAELDPTDYQIQLDAAEAEYQRVKAEAERVMALYKENVTTPDQLELIELAKSAAQSGRARGTGRPTKKERRERDYGNYRRPAFGVDAAGMYGILGRYDYPVKKIKRNADRKQSAKTHQGYGVFWQADVFSREEP